jgi:hypothetical protein
MRKKATERDLLCPVVGQRAHGLVREATFESRAGLAVHDAVVVEAVGELVRWRTPPVV